MDAGFEKNFVRYHWGRTDGRTDGHATKRECEKWSLNRVNNDKSGANVRKQERRAAYGLLTVRARAPLVGGETEYGSEARGL